MAQLDGGQILVRVLERAGIGTIFTLHGGHLDPIFQAACAAGIRLIDTRHEQAAGHAADGWARTTGQTGVCIVTAGPGFTDSITAIANAYLDCIPVLFIAGAAPLRDAETLPLQGGIDQVAMVTPITKWACRITHTHRIADLAAQALRIARSGRPGPVFLEIPIDVLFARVDETKLRFPAAAGSDAHPAPAPAAVARAIELLAGAERPVILAGGGAWFSGCTAELLAFAERTGIAVFTNSKARGMVPAGHARHGGSFADLMVAAQMGVGRPDVVLVLGARFGLFLSSGETGTVPGDARVIQVDIESEEIGRNRDVDVAMVADCRQALAALDSAAAARTWTRREAWGSAIASLHGWHAGMFADAISATAAPIHPYRLAAELARVLPADAVVVADGGETASWADMTVATTAGGNWLSHGYLGCLGTGMPFAIAAKAAHPDRPVVCIVGDGSVGLNFAEFDTMVRHGLPIVVVVNNDAQWGMSAHGQDLIYGEGRRVVTDLAPTRYDQAAAGFGCHGEFVEKPEDLAPALARALAAGRPACVNVLTDRNVIAPITIAMVGQASGALSLPEGGASRVRIPYYADLEA